MCFFLFLSSKQTKLNKSLFFNNNLLNLLIWIVDRNQTNIKRLIAARGIE